MGVQSLKTDEIRIEKVNVQVKKRDLLRYVSPEKRALEVPGENQGAVLPAGESEKIEDTQELPGGDNLPLASLWIAGALIFRRGVRESLERIESIEEAFFTSTLTLICDETGKDLKRPRISDTALNYRAADISYAVILVGKVKDALKGFIVELPEGVEVDLFRAPDIKPESSQNRIDHKILFIF